MSKQIKLILIIVLATMLILSMVACGVVEYGEAASGSNNGGDSLGGLENQINNGSNPQLEPPKNAEGEYVATFETYGGTPVKQVIISVIEVSPTTTFDGLTFAGWFLQPDLTGERVVFPFNMTQNTTFYAKWVTDGVKEIVSIEDLKSVALAMEGQYKLMTDLDLRSVDWMPLGMSFTKEEGEEKVTLKQAIIPFTGKFDGNGKTIYNLTLTPQAPEKQFNYLPYGLFSALGNGGVVENLNLNSYRINLDPSFSDFYLGSIVGQMKGGVLRNCNSIGSINNPELVYEGTIWDDFLGSYANPTSDTFIGGMVGGVLTGSIDNCNSGGIIVSKTVADGMLVGGLVGYNWDGVITNSSSSASVEGKYAGNLAGYNNGRISDCWATGVTTGSMSYPAIAGGLVGYNDINGRIERCYSTGEVSARTAGGLVGINMYNYSVNGPLNIGGDPILQAEGINNETIGAGTGGIIRNCYTTSNVSASEYAGGLVGRAESNMPIKGREDIKSVPEDDFYFISHCFSYGNVRAIAEEIAYKDENGKYLITSGVYHTVYAGGLIGHGMEVRIQSCIAFGNVTALSKRRAGTDDAIYNEAFANNAIGLHSATSDINSSNHVIVAVKNVFGSVNQVVKRNVTVYSDFNTVEALPFVGNGDRNVNNVEFLTGRVNGLAFDTSIWNFNNINIEDGRRPTLY